MNRPTNAQFTFSTDVALGLLAALLAVSWFANVLGLYDGGL